MAFAAAIALFHRHVMVLQAPRRRKFLFLRMIRNNPPGRTTGGHRASFSVVRQRTDPTFALGFVPPHAGNVHPHTPFDRHPPLGKQPLA